jgi:hypothetical protein
MKSSFEDSKVHRDSNSQSGNSLGSVVVQSFTFSYTPKNMKCDFRASFLARTFANLWLGHKPKAKVAIVSPTRKEVNVLIDT